MTKVGGTSMGGASTANSCGSHCGGQGWTHHLCASGICHCSACMTCPNHDAGSSYGCR